MPYSLNVTTPEGEFNRQYDVAGAEQVLGDAEAAAKMSNVTRVVITASTNPGGWIILHDTDTLPSTQNGAYATLKHRPT